MGKGTFHVDLRPDKRLLDPSFEGYKLSLDSVPIYRKSLSAGVDFIQPNDDQFSFSHVKLFSLHNHLHVNPFNNSIFFVDKNWNVTKILLDKLNKLEDLQIVWKIPDLSQHQKRLYNVSIAFASSDVAVVSDGAGNTHIIKITFNEIGEQWEVTTSLILRENGAGFIVSSVEMQTSETEEELHIVFMYIEEKIKLAKETISTGLFQTLIEWVTLARNQDTAWKRKSFKQLEVNGSVEYISLECGSKALFVACDKVPKWIFDSEKAIIEDKNENAKTDNEIGNDTEKLYSWMQGEEEITVWLPLPENITKNDLLIAVKPKELRVELKGEIIVSGELCNRIDQNLTSWSFEKSKLEILLMKHESGLMWLNLLVDDKRGEQIYDPELVGKVHERLAHLCSDEQVNPGQPSFNSQQLEECDATSCDTAVLVRMSVENHSASHEISLSSFQYLFKVHCDPKQTPAICLRHDVDGCVWQFDSAKEDDEHWPHKHIGTFLAFGYVQASKNQKKYLMCPADMSYALICEGSRHLYLYRQPSAVLGELRHRTSGKKVNRVSKQQLINLDSNEHILGICATNSSIFVLTENIIHFLVVNE